MVEIREVTNKRQLRQFVNYPNILYRDVPQYIPPLISEELDDWNPRKNPAFAYCDAKCWLALRNGRVVGRIGAILSRRANEKWGANRMRFTQVDFIDDEEVSSALFRTVEDYARQMGCDEVHGPLGFTDLDREGMLIEGFTTLDAIAATPTTYQGREKSLPLVDVVIESIRVDTFGVDYGEPEKIR
jgi:hypothetical protein